MSKSKKKIIHALTIIDKSGSMERFRNCTIEGINANISALKKEVDDDTEIINTQLQFSANGGNWANCGGAPSDRDFVFVRVGAPVSDIPDMTPLDYVPDGGTPLLDAIGYAVEKVKDFHGNKLGDENLKIIVTIFSDGEENSSIKQTKASIKKMIEHFQSDGKWTFTFIGCGSFEAVSSESTSYGIAACNTVAYAATEKGFDEAYGKIATSYTNFARSAKLGLVDDDLFTEKAAPVGKKK